MTGALTTKSSTSLLATALFVVTLFLSAHDIALSNNRQETPVVTASTVVGKPLFLSNCSGCHGANAQGGEGPNLHHLGLSSSFISSTVTKGIQDQMPAFSKLTPAQLSAVTAYVETLQ